MTGAEAPTRAKGMALPAVLALLAAVSMLLVAYGLLTTVHWLAARNLRQGLHAWALAESMSALAASELRAEFRREGALPPAYLPPDSGDLDITVHYEATDGEHARLEVLASFGSAAVRRVLELDMEH